MAADQSNWYVIEAGVVAGLDPFDIWLCIFAGLLSLLIGITRLLITPKKEKQSETADDMPLTSGKLYRLIAMKKQWVSERSHKRFVYLKYLASVTVLFPVVFWLASCFILKYPLFNILTRHFSLCLILGY